MTANEDGTGGTPWPARMVIELIKLIIVLIGGSGPN